MLPIFIISRVACGKGQVTCERVFFTLPTCHLSLVTTFGKVNQNQPYTLEENDDPKPRPVLVFGPAMKTMLIFSLFFSCWAFYFCIAGSPKFAWLVAHGPEAGFPVNTVRLSEAFYNFFIFAIPAIVFANAFAPEKFKWFKLNKPVSPQLLLLGVIAMAAAIFGFLYIENIITNALTDPQVKEYEKAVQAQNNWVYNMPAFSDLLTCLFASAFVPAVCEELFFRGTLQQQLSEWTKKPHIAIFITAVFFTLLHADIAGLPTVFAGGLMLGYAFYWTGSLRTNILMHFIFNGLTIVLDFIQQRSPALAKWEPGNFTTIIGLSLSAVFMFLLWKKTRSQLVS
jgi:membrane protease YdiL (CAAX protease family)